MLHFKTNHRVIFWLESQLLHRGSGTFEHIFSEFLEGRFPSRLLYFPTRLHISCVEGKAADKTLWLWRVNDLLLPERRCLELIVQLASQLPAFVLISSSLNKASSKSSRGPHFYIKEPTSGFVSIKSDRSINGPFEFFIRVKKEQTGSCCAEFAII